MNAQLETLRTKKDDDIEIYAYLETLWRYKYLILGIIIIAFLVTAVVNELIAPRYEATSVIQVGGKVSLGSVDVYKNVLLSPDITKRMSEAAKNLEIEPRVEIFANAIKLIIQGNSPKDAESLGTLWYNAFLSEIRKAWIRKLEKQVALQRDVVDKIRKEFHPAYLMDISSQNRAERQMVVEENGYVIVQAMAELKQSEILLERVRQNQFDDIAVVYPFQGIEKPVSPHKVLNFAKAILLALLIGVFFAFSIESWKSYKQRNLAG